MNNKVKHFIPKIKKPTDFFKHLNVYQTRINLIKLFDDMKIKFQNSKQKI